MNSKIVIINQTSGYLMRDIARVFIEQYEEVVLLASWPINGVKTDRIIAFDKRSSVRRLWTWLVATLQICWKIIWKYRNDELFIVSNPPFASLLPMIMKNRYSLLIFDIYPDILINQQMLGEKNLIIRWWRRANRKVFAKAKCIFTISEGMKVCLSQYVEVEKIKVVPLWPNTSQIHRIENSENLFIKEHQLESKFVVLYSGNLGSSHRMDVLVDVAKKIKDKDIAFLIIGEGAKKKLIAERIEKEQCQNVILMPRQPYEMLSHSLSAADIAVVTLDMNASQMSVPSKTFNLMAVGAPLMCIASPESELGNLVRKYDVGEIFSPDDIEGMMAFILRVKDDADLQKRYIYNAQEASSHFTSDNARLFVGE